MDFSVLFFATDNNNNETVWRIEDGNGDGDTLDAGEVTVFIDEETYLTRFFILPAPFPLSKHISPQR